MNKLTKHQSEALKLFPDTGWYAVRDVPDFKWLYVLHPEATAQKLFDKGFLERRLTGYIPGVMFSGDFEFRKVKREDK